MRQVIIKSGITAQKAIDIAKQTHSGIVYYFDIDDDHDQLVYSVGLVDSVKKEIYLIEIDAASGK